MKLITRNDAFDALEQLLSEARALHSSDKVLVLHTRYDFAKGLVLEKIETKSVQETSKKLETLNKESGNFFARLLRQAFGYTLVRPIIEKHKIEGHPVAASKAVAVIEEAQLRYVEDFMSQSLANRDVMSALRRVQIERKMLPGLFDRFERSARKSLDAGQLLAWDELRMIVEEYVFEEVLKMKEGDREASLKEFWGSKVAMLEHRLNRLDAPLKDAYIDRSISYDDYEGALIMLIEARDKYAELLEGTPRKTYERKTQMYKDILEGFTALVDSFDDQLIGEEGLVRMSEEVMKKYPLIGKRTLFEFLERAFLLEAYKKKFHSDEFEAIYEKSINRLLKSSVMKQEQLDREYAHQYPWLSSISRL